MRQTPSTHNSRAAAAGFFVQRCLHFQSIPTEHQHVHVCMYVCMYALSKQPLISGLQAVSQAKQGRFADHAPGCEALQDIRAWWDELIVAVSDLDTILMLEIVGWS